MKIEGLKTLFVDIDGTLLYHHGLPNKQSVLETKTLPGVEEKLGEWNNKGYVVILVTTRRESERELTIKQLQSLGIVYDRLITGIGRGTRVLINDIKPDSDNNPTAVAINLERNKGIENIEI